MPAASSRPPTPSATPPRSATGASRGSTIDTPLNIHLTGCHHSCAQHYISDIGLIAAKVPVGDEDDTVEGYHLFAGGGFGPNADIGQEVYHDLKAEDAPKTVERLLKAYLATPRLARRNVPDLCAPPRRRNAAQAGRCGGLHMNQMTPPPKNRNHSLQRAVFRSAALLAERLLCRTAVDSMVRRRCRRSRARPCCRARPAMATTAKRPGTTRPCRSPIA